MEIIKKRVCLEDFKSRIPANIETYESIDINKGSWNEIPKMIKILGKIKRYGFFINLYYILMNIIKNAIYYKWDGVKWYKITDYDWRNVVKIKGETPTDNMVYYVELPTGGNNNEIIGLIDSDSYFYMYDYIKEKFGNNKENKPYNGLDYINETHNIIALHVIPIEYDGELVPYTVFHNELDDLITDITKIKEYSANCYNSKFEKYYGDKFLDYLKELKKTKYELIVNDEETTLDIPILLTGKTIDLGMYKSDDIDVILEGEENVESKDNCLNNEPINQFVKTTGESRLKSLRRRKISVDDNGNELDYIIDYNIDKDDNVIITICNGYKVEYIKNIQMYNSEYYGDYIYSIEYNYNTKEVTFIYVLGEKLKLKNDESEKKLQIDRSIKPPFELNNDTGKDWKGEGIWYREVYKYDETEVKVNEKYFSYNKINFSEKEITYQYNGIDFPRKNYILCEEIIYKSDNYLNNITECDALFRDEKMMGLSLPLKENYDVNIERGSSAAFERHLQLTELKTWQDLENYRNGMFLNK